MTTNTFEEVNYLSLTDSRLTEAFKDKPVYKAYLTIVMNQIMQLQIALKDLMQLRSLDTASGEQLDLIGKIVGQSRVLVNYDAFPYFGFDGSPAAETFGTTTDGNVGGLFRSYLQEEGGAATVDDETYRFLLKVRIVANMTKATPEAIITGMNFITGNTTSTIVEQPNAHLQIELENTLTEFQAYFLKGLSSVGSIIPVPIGVAVDYVFFEPDYFGFLEDSNAQPLISDTGGYGRDYGSIYGKVIAATGGGWIADLQ